MGPVAVAFGAFDLFHKNMIGVVPRIGDARRVRGFFVLFPVAGEADLPRHDHFAVPGHNLVVTEHGKIEELPHLVGLGGVVALMAVYFMMDAGHPRLVRGVMDMTDPAGVGIVLEVIVDQVGRNEGPD
jgi:hypothetical protein